MRVYIAHTMQYLYVRNNGYLNNSKQTELKRVEHQNGSFVRSLLFYLFDESIGLCRLYYATFLICFALHFFTS